MEVCYVFVILSVILSEVTSNFSQNEHVCGRPIGTEFRLEEDRIVAGYDVGYYRYPWYAALIRYNSVSCGGALIGPRTVVSAAHCFKEFMNAANNGFLNLASVYTVKLGVYNICETEQTRRDYSVEKVIIHEKYKEKKPYYDISLLILAGDTNKYLPICLPQSEIKQRPEAGTVPGLGVLRYQGAMPCTVHEARLLVYNDTDCYNMINRTGNDPKAITNAFCAGYIRGGIDTCQGDSGGPLQSMNVDGDYVLIENTRRDRHLYLDIWNLKKYLSDNQTVTTITSHEAIFETSSTSHLHENLNPEKLLKDLLGKTSSGFMFSESFILCLYLRSKFCFLNKYYMSI